MFYWPEEMLRLWEIASFTQKLLGRPPDPQPKIKGSTMIAALSKFVCIQPPPPQQQFAQNREKMEKLSIHVHQHQELYALVVISAVRLLYHEQNVGNSKVHRE